MTHIPEERLALYAGGELQPKELRSTEEHLATCRECRDLLAEFRGDLVALQIGLDEPTPDELLAVRGGVIQQLQKRRKAVAGWRWAVASIAAAASVAAVMFLHPEPSHGTRVNPSLAATAYLNVPYRPVADVSIPNLKAKVVHARTAPRPEPAGIRSVNLLAQQDGPRILKMMTADPNVVILWQLDERTHDRD
jgi:anti-sigma factor RsiW